MSSLSANLYGFSLLARHLRELGPRGRLPTVLAAPTAARLRSHLSAAGCLATLDMVPPTWFRDVVMACDPLASAAGFHAGGAGKSGAGSPILAHAFDADELALLPPLTRLMHGLAETMQPARLRTLDWLAADRQECAAVVVGSGFEALQLLSGGRRLLERHRPLVVVDVADLVSLHPEPLGDAAADATVSRVLDLLPDYVATAPCRADAHCETTRGAETPRFLVVAPRGTAAQTSQAGSGGTAVRPPHLPASQHFAASDLFVASNGRYDPARERICWLGPPSGLSMLIDCDVPAGRLQVVAHTRLPHGLRVAVDGMVAVAASAPAAEDATRQDRTSRQPARLLIDVPLPLAASGARLRHILLTPIRMSTTEPPPPLEIEGITAVAG